MSSLEGMTDMLKNAKNFQFEQPVKYSFYNLDKNRSNIIQNGKFEMFNIKQKSIETINLIRYIVKKVFK